MPAAARPSAADAPRPLTEAQAGLWYAQRLDPANPLFNTGQYAELYGPLDLPAFRAAVDRTAAEADALCLAIDDGPSGPVQHVDESRRPRLDVADLAAEADPRAAALALVEADIAAPLDPARAPLAAERLFVLGPGHHLWYRRAHHLAVDGYGTVLLNNRTAELYNGAAGSPFGPLDAVFEEDAAYRRSEARERDAAYWRDYLAGLPGIAAMAPGRPVSAHGFERAARTLAPALAARLRARAEALGVPWPDLVTALTAAYCRRFAGAPELIAGVPHMGRFGSASARVPAMVMNVLPLRLAPDDAEPLATLVHAVSRALLRGRRHGRYRSEQMRRDLGLLGGHRRLYGPLINVLPFDLPPRLAGLELSMHVLSTGPVDDITFTFRGDGVAGLLLEVDTNPGLHDREDGAAHAARLVAFLDRALSAETLAEIPIATPGEARHAVETVNRTAHPVPATTLAALLGARLAATPEAPALVSGAGTWSYAGLERRTRALALRLRRLGVGRERIVAVAIPRSPELVTALLAVIRAGGAYLPLDPDHPPERIARLLDAAQPRLVLATPETAALLPAAAPVLSTADWPADPAAETLPDPDLAPDDLAYVIYTSGSTGAPKGVMIEHRAIVNRLEWMRAHYSVSAADRILLKTPATFDVSVWEFFLPFLCGGALVVAPPGAHRDPRAIAALIRGHGVTTVHFVPSMLAAFLDEPAARGLKLARVFASGEELPADLCARFHETVTAELHNLYGPTEAAVDVTRWQVTPGDRSRPVPIGHPVWNTRLYVLDDRRRPLPPGVTGHLWLGGVQLARGYLGRPDLTAERFVPDPFVPGARMYRTGDLARRRRDGALVYAGRADDQVKLRGRRVEPGEIEATVLSSGLARQVAVVLREDRPGHRRLVAYPVPGPGYAEQALRAHLAARLPDYMVPAAFMPLDALPVTANGKLDRAALPPPALPETGGRAPATPTEAALARLYAEILDLPARPSADADFFALGGDSLLATTLTMRISETFGHDPGLGALFERPDIAGLARLIDAGAPGFDSGLQPLLRLASGDAALAPLFVVHPVGGIAWCYRHLARALSPRRAVHGLQAPALAPGTASPGTLEALAADYAARLVSASPDGPHHLAGWSVGGIVAQAVAARLEAEGRDVGVVALLDAYPADCWRTQEEPTPAEALRALLAVAGHVPEDHPGLATREQIVGFLKTGGSPLGRLPDEALDGVVRVVLDTNRLVRGHRHARIGGTLTHFRAALDHRDGGLSPALWRPYARHLDVVELPFLHRDMAGAAASAMVARALDGRLAAADAARRGDADD